MGADREAKFDEVVGGFEDDGLVNVTLYGKEGKMEVGTRERGE